jgi:hypothetical protein
MSYTIPEQILQATVTALNATGKPAAVPATQRDRWLDLDTDSDSIPALLLSGWEDLTLPNQQEDGPIDRRRLVATFELFAKGSSGVTASQAVDAMVQWISRLAGPVELGSTFAGLAIRVRVPEKAAVVAKGNICRALLRLAFDYRTLVADATLVK